MDRDYYCTFCYLVRHSIELKILTSLSIMFHLIHQYHVAFIYDHFDKIMVLGHRFTKKINYSMEKAKSNFTLTKKDHINIFIMHRNVSISFTIQVGVHISGTTPTNDCTLVYLIETLQAGCRLISLSILDHNHQNYASRKQFMKVIALSLQNSGSTNLPSGVDLHKLKCFRYSLQSRLPFTAWMNYVMLKNTWNDYTLPLWCRCRFQERWSTMTFLI